MKKLLIPLVIIALMIIIFFSWCQNKAISTIDIDSMTIKALPSPPKVKTIDKKDDIEKVVSFINSIDKEVTIQVGTKGWEFWIQTNGKKEHSIIFIGDKVSIDKIWYKINTAEIKKLRELYNGLDYKEEPVVK